MLIPLVPVVGDTTLGASSTAVGGYVGVAQLQKELRRIAYEFNKRNVDPAKYDGTLTLGTIIALANAAPIVGTKIHAAVGIALNVIEYIKAPIKKLPYGDVLIEFILSPWIVDHVYDAILAIIRLIPGGGNETAKVIDRSVNTAKAAIAQAAAPIATALALIKKKSSAGLGANAAVSAVPLRPTTASTGANAAPNPPPGFTWVPEQNGVPGHWERLRPGQTPQPGPTGAYVDVRDHRGMTGGAGGVTVTDANGNPVEVRLQQAPLAPLQPGRPGVVRDHRAWPKGKEINASDWGRARTYYGYCPKDFLATRDREAWEKNKNVGPHIPANAPAALRSKLEKLRVRYGVIAFKIFRGFDGARMGAFWDEQTQLLKIAAVPEPSTTKYPWDYVTDAFQNAAEAISDLAQDVWNVIAEHADDVYRTVKKYGCAIVNNDVVVSITAAGTGIVATPAASGAVVAGAQAGKAACAVLEVTELLYAIYKVLTLKVPAPPPLTSPEPPAVTPSTVGQVLLPPTPPRVPAAKLRYPVGSIATYDPELRRYRVAIPVGARLQLGASNALGAATHYEAALEERVPPTVPLVPVTIYQRHTGTLPFYKTATFWIVSAGVIATGGYVLYRRRARLTKLPRTA
jgi:hypothetical protein